MDDSVHVSCQEAIAQFRMNSESSNVNTSEAKVSCPHLKSSCNWVGNGIHFACLKEQKTSDVPVNVYDSFSGGNRSVLSND